jgi:hypothetical protein
MGELAREANWANEALRIRKVLPAATNLTDEANPLQPPNLRPRTEPVAGRSFAPKSG